MMDRLGKGHAGIKKSKILAIFTAVLIMLSSGSCVPAGRDAESGGSPVSATAEQYSDDVKATQADSSKITVCFYTGDHTQRKAAERVYTVTSHEATVDEIYGSNLSMTSGQIFTQMMAGEGPDVFIAYTPCIPSLYKMMVNHAFYELDPLMKSDPTFNIGKYDKTIMDCGKYKGKRYLVPLSYIVPAFYTTKSYLKHNRLEGLERSGTTWTELRGMLKGFDTKLGFADRYLYGNFNDYWQMKSYTYLEYPFMRLMQYCYPAFIDYGSMKCDFDSAGFVELLETIKDIQELECPPDTVIREKDIDATLHHNDIPAYLIKSDKIGMLTSDWGVSNILLEYNSFFRSQIGEDLYPVPYPLARKGEKRTAFVKMLAGINANSRKIEKAYSFIKALLDDFSQSSKVDYIFNSGNGGLPWYFEGLSVNRSIVKDDLGYYENTYKESDMIQHRVKFVTISPGLAESIGKLAGSVKKCVIYDQRVEDLIEAEVDRYLAGRESAEKASKIINSKITLYLNE